MLRKSRRYHWFLKSPTFWGTWNEGIVIFQEATWRLGPWCTGIPMNSHKTPGPLKLLVREVWWEVIRCIWDPCCQRAILGNFDHWIEFNLPGRKLIFPPLQWINKKSKLKESNLLDWHECCVFFWVVVSFLLNFFHPYPWGNDPTWQAHFFNWLGTTNYMGVSKNRVFFPPKSSHFNRVFPYFHYPFWGFPSFRAVFFFVSVVWKVRVANQWVGTDLVRQPKPLDLGVLEVTGGLCFGWKGLLRDH